MSEQTVFDYIKSEENNFRTTRIQLTRSKSWNMYEFIERCTNVSNGWFHSGVDDGNRPYDDIVTPIFNVAARSEGFDVKDIVPFVNDISNSYKSFIVKKRHPRWARDNKIDTLIDDVVESSIIYDLVLLKKLPNMVAPEVIDLRTIAFCDQTDALSGPLCTRHEFSVQEMNDFKGKWDDDAIDLAIMLSKNERTSADKTSQSPSKIIEVYELHGVFKKTWLDGMESNEYVPQMHIVAFYKDESGKDQGITLFKGKSKPLRETFKALKVDRIRSRGRACGKSVVESLFEPQTWNNYSGIKLKQLMDAAVTLFQTDSEEYGNARLDKLKPNTILKHEQGKPITRLDGNVQNVALFQAHQQKMQMDARVIGSASEAQLGVSPVSGTPFALQSLVVQQGQGIHEYRQGKIASFFADEVYPDWILPELVKELNSLDMFSEELTIEELEEIADNVATNAANEIILNKILSREGFQIGEAEAIREQEKQKFMQAGSRRFFTELKDEFKDIPMDVFINIKGKQKDLPAIADKLTNLLREATRNPQGASMFAKQYNELLESSGFSPIDFANMTKQPVQTETAQPNPVIK